MPRMYKNGSRIYAFDNQDVVIENSLEFGVYSLREDEHENIYLTKIEVNKDNTKLYGRINGDTDKVISLFEYRDQNVGILVSGERGTGKSRFSRNLLNRFMEKFHKPVIFVDSGVNLLRLSKFINLIDESCMIIIDEFEKKYKEYEGEDRDDERSPQSDMLSLLDGCESPKNKCLFVLVCNDITDINKYLFDRPGRVYYHFKYKTMDRKSIEEYCLDNIDNKEYIKNILEVKQLLGGLSFDSLKAIVYECNRLKLPPSEVALDLNINSLYGIDVVWKVRVTDNEGHVYTRHSNIHISKILFDGINEAVTISGVATVILNKENLVEINDTEIIFKDDEYVITLTCIDGSNEEKLAI